MSDQPQPGPTTLGIHALMPATEVVKPEPKPMWAKEPVKCQFKGLPNFIDDAAKVLGLTDDSLRHKAKGIWFAAQASNALGNACHQGKEAAQQSIDRAILMRDALVVAAAGIEAAVVETAVSLGLDAGKLSHAVLTPIQSDPQIDVKVPPDESNARKLRRS